MRWPPLGWSLALLYLTLLLLAPLASAQEAVPERGALRLRAGASHHQALLVEGGEARPAAGWTGDDLGLGALLFADGPLGGALELQRTVVRLVPTAPGGEAQRYSLLQGSLGLAARGTLGPLGLLARVGYGFSQLPFGLTPAGAASTAWQHGVVVAPRVRLALPWWALQLEASGELWLPLHASDAQHRPLEVQRGAVGLALGRHLGRVGPFGWSLWLEAQGARTAAARAVGEAAFLQATRVGLGTELTWDALPSSTP